MRPTGEHCAGENLAEEKLQRSEAHYRLLTEDVQDVVWKNRQQSSSPISPG
jgi:hypothetical protein